MMMLPILSTLLNAGWSRTSAKQFVLNREATTRLNLAFVLGGRCHLPLLLSTYGLKSSTPFSAKLRMF
jgi:hypothetical protein